MSVYRPSYRDPKTGEKKVSRVWWYKFALAGKRIQESSHSTRKTVAKEAEKNRRLKMEQTLAGMPLEKREDRINSVSDIIKKYRTRYEVNHRDRPQSILFSKNRLAHVTRLLGTRRLPDLTEDAILDYIKQRYEEKVSGRTINMEIGELSRAIGKPWSTLWPTVRRQEERQDVGKALSHEEEQRLLEATCKKPRWRLGGVMIRIALMTAMRSGEITKLTWGQIDLAKRCLIVGRSKSRKGTGRQIPMNDDLYALLTMHRDWFRQKFGEAKAEHYLFPAGKPQPTDPTRSTLSFATVWNSVRKAAAVECRLHDLRHTALTKMAEAGVPESTMLALAGHMSRAMLERYSHIRMAAKREAVAALRLTPPSVPQTQDLAKESAKVSPTVKVQ